MQNALDAMEGGGTLGLRTFVNDHDVRLEVRDSGIGMNAEVRERAFEPFFTTKGRAGTGLGLAEVYGIVKRHRGRAEIESMPGAGTIIRLIFPRYARDEQADDEDETPASSARRVLLVEDQQDSRDFMRAVLLSDGHWVDAVGGVDEALQLLEGASLAYDVLVTDIGLADRSGWELVTAVRERWPSMRVGIVTGWEPGAGAGADGDFVLRKPVRTSELLAHVAALS